MITGTRRKGQGLQWYRAFAAALVAELVLIIPTGVITAATENYVAVLNAVIPLAAFLAFIAAGYWTASPAQGRVLINGSLPGFIGIGLYILLTLVASGAIADFDLASSVRPAYLLAHVLKIAGGALGGWLVARHSPAQAG